MNTDSPAVSFHRHVRSSCDDATFEELRTKLRINDGAMEHDYNVRLGCPTMFVLRHACTDSVQGTSDGLWFEHRFTVNFDREGFHVERSFRTPMYPLLHFLDELRAVNRTLQGTATFDALEHDLRLEAKVDKKGHITWSGLIRSVDGPILNLRFEIHDDQTSLPSVIAPLEAMILQACDEENRAPAASRRT